MRRERIVDLLALDLELALVRDHLPRCARMVCDGCDAVGAGAEDLDRPRLRVRALGLSDDRAHGVARDRARDEHHEAVEPRDAGAAVGERIDVSSSSSPRRGRAPCGRCSSIRARSAGVHEQLEQRLLRVAAVLGLIPDPLTIP